MPHEKSADAVREALERMERDGDEHGAAAIIRQHIDALTKDADWWQRQCQIRKEDYATLTEVFRADEAKYRERAEQAEARLAALAVAAPDEGWATPAEIAGCIKSRLFAQFMRQGFWHAHHVDLVWRHDGKDVREEADWLKDLWYRLRNAKPHAPAKAREVTDADVERAAKALWNSTPHKMLEKAGYPTAWEDQVESTKRDYRKNARAALATFAEGAE